MIPLLLIYVATLSVGLPANLFSLAAVLAKLRRGLAPADLLLLNLTAADLLLLLCLPAKVAEVAAGDGRWPLPAALCPLANFCFYSCLYLGSLFLAALAVERYLSVAAPLRPKGRRRLGVYAVASGGLWLVAAAHCSVVFAAAFGGAANGSVEADGSGWAGVEPEVLVANGEVNGLGGAQPRVFMGAGVGHRVFVHNRDHSEVLEANGVGGAQPGVFMGDGLGMANAKVFQAQSVEVGTPGVFMGAGVQPKVLVRHRDHPEVLEAIGVGGAHPGVSQPHTEQRAKWEVFVAGGAKATNRGGFMAHEAKISNPKVFMANGARSSSHGVFTSNKAKTSSSGVLKGSSDETSDLGVPMSNGAKISNHDLFMANGARTFNLDVFTATKAKSSNVNVFMANGAKPSNPNILTANRTRSSNIFTSNGAESSNPDGFKANRAKTFNPNNFMENGAKTSSLGIFMASAAKTSNLEVSTPNRAKTANPKIFRAQRANTANRKVFMANGAKTSSLDVFTLNRAKMANPDAFRPQRANMANPKVLMANGAKTSNLEVFTPNRAQMAKSKVFSTQRANMANPEVLMANGAKTSNPNISKTIAPTISMVNIFRPRGPAPEPGFKCYDDFSESQLRFVLPLRLELFLVLFLVPFGVTVFCYVNFVRLLLARPNIPRQKKQRAVGLAVATMVNFGVCFAPYNLSHVVGFVEQRSPSWRHYTLVLSCLNAALDPLVFYFCSTAVQQAVAGLVAAARRKAAACCGRRPVANGEGASA